MKVIARNDLEENLQTHKKPTGNAPASKQMFFQPLRKLRALPVQTPSTPPPDISQGNQPPPAPAADAQVNQIPPASVTLDKEPPTLNIPEAPPAAAAAPQEPPPPPVLTPPPGQAPEMAVQPGHPFGEVSPEEKPSITEDVIPLGDKKQKGAKEQRTNYTQLPTDEKKFKWNNKKPSFPSYAQDKKTGKFYEITKDRAGKIKRNEVEVVKSISDLKLLLTEIAKAGQICTIHFFKKDGTMTVLLGKLKWNQKVSADKTPLKESNYGTMFISEDLALRRSLEKKVKEGKMTKEEARAASERSPYLMGIRHIRSGGKTYVVDPSIVSYTHFTTPPDENEYILKLAEEAEKRQQNYQPTTQSTSSTTSEQVVASLVNNLFVQSFSNLPQAPENTANESMSQEEPETEIKATPVRKRYNSPIVKYFSDTRSELLNLQSLSTSMQLNYSAECFDKMARDISQAIGQFDLLYSSLFDGQAQGKKTPQKKISSQRAMGQCFDAMTMSLRDFTNNATMALASYSLPRLNEMAGSARQISITLDQLFSDIVRSVPSFVKS